MTGTERAFNVGLRSRLPLTATSKAANIPCT